MFDRLWTLILKELQSQLRDRDSRRILILPVILQIALFPFAATLEVEHAYIGIYNQDAGARSVELTQRLAKSSSFPHVKLLYGINDVRNAIENQQVLGVISMSSDFSRNIDSKKTASLQVITDGRRSNAAQIATSYVQEIVDHYNADLSKQTHTKMPPSIITPQNWFNPNLEYKWFVLPCFVAIISTLGCLIVTTMSIAREKEQGTFEQLLVSPLTPGLIILGKIIPALVIVCIQTSIVLFASIVLYRIPFQGSLLLLYICILCYGLSLSGVGLLISSVSSTQQQAFLGIFGFLMPALLLSGFVAPIENIPEPLRAVTWFNPIRHFIVISKGIYLKGFDISLVWTDLWPLFVIGLITLTMAYIRFKHYSRG
ncbi:MAG: ABC transporter permease [Gammaproteobacteria bacterium]